MLQLQSSRNKALQEWRKRNKLALKQNTKQSSLKNDGDIKKPNIKARKPPTPRPPATSKTTRGDNPKRHRAPANEDSVVISKSALDDLLKQLVDAKQAATVLPPINNTGIVSAVDVHQDGNNEALTGHDKTTAPVRKDQRQHPQQINKHVDLDHSDIPGLSSLKSPPSSHVEPAVTETTFHTSDLRDKSRTRKSTDVEHVYFPFGRPGGGAPNKPRHPNFVESNYEIHATNQDMSSQHLDKVQQSKTITSDIYSPQGSTNTSPRKYTDISPTHAKSVYLEQWQIEERESKRRKGLEHYEHIKAQVAEKERKKEEIRMKKALEERQEEERLARQRERLQREYQEEQERIRRKEEDVARRNAHLYQKIQEAESGAFDAKQKSKLAPRFSHGHNISVPKIYEEQYSDYESGTDDPDSRTNLDQFKVRLSFDSALRSPSMCNVVDSTHEQDVSTSPRKHVAKFKSKSPQKQNIKLAVSETKDKKVTQGTRHRGLSKDKSIADKQGDQDVAKRIKQEKRKSMIPISKEHIKKATHQTEKDKVDTNARSNCAIKKHRKEMAGDNVVTQQRRQKVSKIKAETSNTSVDTFATQSSTHIRPDSPPVPTLAKKLANSAASSSGQSTDGGSIKSPTILSKRTQRKVARRLDYKELPSKPKPNSVVRMQQQQQLQEPLNQQHEYLRRPSNSPPVPALAKKLQTHQLHKESSVDFDDNKRPVLPPITGQNDSGPNNIELDENTVPMQANRRPQPVLPPVGKTDQVPVEFKSYSPPVPALAKRLSQQISHSHGNHSSNVTSNNEGNRFTSSELHSDSRFTYFSEPDTNLTAGNNPYYSAQPLQQVVYVPVSPQHFSAMYSQSAVNSINFQGPQPGVPVPPQIMSPIPIMMSPQTLSPVHSHYSQSSGVTVGMSKPADNTVQSPHIEVSNSNIEQSNVTIQQHDSRTLGHDEPPLVVTTQEHQTHLQGRSSPVHSPTSQSSQEKEAVLQHLALMKKRLLAQQQSITKKQSSFTSQPDDKQPPSL
ncbi:calponin homology domain-containing protein DDB_G0272472-like isoform X2 [Dysidea avara]|uniref:calponin homology domain-containing protein DDB_G0272472-like isoform X2 n=1 Tax=Dysidea avara TaxID=196820 RepID=UPI003320ECF7